MMNQMSSTVGPMTRRRGMPMGVSMENGMGMLDGTPGVPLGDDYGLSLGRGMGVGSTNDQPTPNGPLSQERAKQAMSPMQQTMPDMQHGEMQGMQHGEAEVSENANQVPGFPQDAFMEGPMMAMDEMVDKPENYGLRPGWSGFMMGMMSFVRVLPPDMYDKIMEMRAQRAPNKQQMRGLEMPGMEPKHNHS
jgi:hypothetical protein